MWLVLWVLYLSIVNVGQRWYGFGWESLLLEAGFVAIFLGNDETAPPVLAILLARWLLFRVEFGAGLIKLRGDPCWRDLTCLYYHHETQPMPGPLSWFFHHLPKPLHRVEVAGNHFAQLVVPFALFAPQPVASMAAAIVIVTQLWLVLSGNFAWLNWLTIILASARSTSPSFASVLPVPDPPALPGPPLWFAGLVIAFAAMAVSLSYWPVRNMVSSHQRMNAAFNPYPPDQHLRRLRQHRPYSPRGGDRRHRRAGDHRADGVEGVRIQRQARRPAPVATPVGALPSAPGLADVVRRADTALCAGLAGPVRDSAAAERSPTLRLLRHNPFPDSPPRYVRAQLYEYRFTTWGELRRERLWWRRTLVGEYLPPVALGKGRIALG